LFAVAVGLAVGLIVLAVIAPLAPRHDRGVLAGGGGPTPGGLMSALPPSGSPGTSPSPQAETAQPPSKPSSGLTARYAVRDKWAGGYQASITIATMVPVTGWNAVLSLPAGVTVNTAWEAEFHQDGRTLTLTPKPWNDSIAQGQSITIGFQASGDGQPATCAVNGVTCSRS
jgi:hypothetical protein